MSQRHSRLGITYRHTESIIRNLQKKKKQQRIENKMRNEWTRRTEEKIIHKEYWKTFCFSFRSLSDSVSNISLSISNRFRYVRLFLLFFFFFLFSVFLVYLAGISYVKCPTFDYVACKLLCKKQAFIVILDVYMILAMRVPIGMRRIIKKKMSGKKIERIKKYPKSQRIVWRNKSRRSNSNQSGEAIFFLLFSFGSQ